MTADTCSRGHGWTPANTGYDQKRGKRYCRTCQREAKQRRLLALEGKPCANCGRDGLHLQSGGWCGTCARRRAKGLPLDAPFRSQTPAKAGSRKPTKRAKPKPKAETVAKPSKLPAGWLNPKPAKKTTGRGDMARSVPEIGVVPITPDSTIHAARALLVRHDATDLADMLGVA